MGSAVSGVVCVCGVWPVVVVVRAACQTQCPTYATLPPRARLAVRDMAPKSLPRQCEGEHETGLVSPPFQLEQWWYVTWTALLWQWCGRGQTHVSGLYRAA